MTITASRSRLVGGLASATALAAALVGGGASVAGAHDGGAIIEVDGTHEEPDGIHFVVEVTYEDDGHGAADAVVTATASGPGGSEVGPVTLEAEDAEAGIYGGVLELTEPGDWDVTFASLGPDGTLEHTESVEEAAGDTGGEAEDAEAGDAGAEDDDADAGDGDAGEELEEVEPEVVSPDGDPEVLNVAETDDDGPSVILLVLVFGAVAAVVAGGFWLVMSRRQQTADTDGSAAAGTAGEADPSDSDPSGSDEAGSDNSDDKTTD